MQILSRRTLREFWEHHPRAKRPLVSWYKIVSEVEWNSSAEVRHTFGSADFVGDSRVIFDIGGNKYRIVARIAYRPFYRVMIKFVGTHDQYNQINPETV
ncbi:MAG TPA: type II toxin-antitoxin system HigB family toxin [Rhizomicrobium sp.]|nr:type II toxin-antitoxin system HigB family toxin [Rhizomicrobium sp.]